MPAGSSGSLPLLGPSRSAPRTTSRATRARGTSPDAASRAAVRSASRALRRSGNRSPRVIVSVTPWRDG